MGLEAYNKKRNFGSTKEPKGKIKKGVTKKFVIQYHVARAKHYDFRIEHNGVLISFAVPKGLSMNPKEKRLAVMVEDHPIDYMDFEGIIPKGNYGAGTVEIYDKGEYSSKESIDKGLKEGYIKIFLSGEKYQGEWSLIHTKDNKWLIIKSEDEYSSSKTIKKNVKLPFNKCEVQLATLVDKVPQGKEWVYEIKYDGYRIISYVEKGRVKLVSRNNIDYTKKFSEITKSLQEIDQDSFVLDGEIVVFDKEGKSDFGLLQQSIKNSTNNFCYVIFDLLALNGKDTRDLLLKERKDKLKRLLFDCQNNLIYSKHIKEGKECFDFAKSKHLEGIIAKNINSKYDGKRNNNWLKIKCFHRQEFIIIGYTTSDKNKLISSLLLGYYDDKTLKYIGKVGTGLTEKLKEELHKRFQKHLQKSKPKSIEIKDKDVTWLKPYFVAEIQYVELTKDKLLRTPSYIGLRDDKKPKEVTLELKNETN